MKLFTKLPVLVVMLLAAAARAENPAIINPAELWAGFDPTAEPLEIESLEKWSEDGRQFEKLRFTAEKIDGQPARVFAIRGLPTGSERVPGILHIHGGGQTASLAWVKFWTERGYAAATFDFCGPWADRKEVTDWGSLKHANMAHAAGGYQIEPSPRASSWYHWTLAARRALTLLASDPRVDGERLGIFGISVGGTLCWMVAGSDARVKTAVPIYGCGYNLDRRKTRWGFGELTPDQKLFQRAVSSEAHATYINCPILFLDATNDFHGWMDDAYDTLGATHVPHWQAFTPRYNHHIDAPQAANLPAWMDYQLRGGPAFPQTPELYLTLSDDNVPRGSLRPHGEVTSIDVYYALGDKPAPNRFWRRVKAEKSGPAWAAPLAVVDAWDKLFAFANVQFASGVCLTTNLTHTVPAQLGHARATLASGGPIDQQLAADSWYFVTANTDPNTAQPFLAIDADGERGPVMRLAPETFPGTASIYVGTHLIGDPQFAGGAKQDLAFDFRGAVEGEGLTVTLKEKDWTPLAKIYTCKIPADQFAADWRTQRLELGKFRTADGQVPSSWQLIDVLQLQGTTNHDQSFRIGNLRWLPRAE